MKKTLLSTAIALSMATSLGVYANDNEFETTPVNKKGSIAATTTTIIGAVAGGPLGLFAGAYLGDVLGKKITKADQYDASIKDKNIIYQQLAASKQEINQLQDSLRQAEKRQQALYALSANKLEFQILFHTGDDTLNDKQYQRLQDLAEFLQKNPQLAIRLHGHADPRGTEGYNNVLSEYRSKNVRSVLEANGVDAERIDSRFYGADQSQAVKGDIDAYAFERRVSIELIEREDNLVLTH